MRQPKGVVAPSPSTVPAKNYNQEYRKRNIAAGMCVQCGKQPPTENSTRCQKCRDYNTARATARRRTRGITPRPPAKYSGLKGYDYLKAVKADQRAAGLCEHGRCPSPPDEGHYQCRPHLDELKTKISEMGKKRIAKGLCRQCGEPWTETQICPTCRPRTRSNAESARLRIERVETAQAADDARVQKELDFIERHLHLLKNDRTREIMLLRYGPGALTLQETGVHFRVTRERIRQIQQEALETIAMLTIENDIPIPIGTHYNPLRLEILETLRAMDPGQSFVIENAPANLGSINTLAKRENFVITTRRIGPKKVRVWLTAKTVAPVENEKVITA